LLLSVLTKLGAKVGFYLPSRLVEGYGLNESAIVKLGRAGTSLLITVDCGITGFREVELSRRLGMDVIVTDHHQLTSEILPPAFAVIDPWRQDCPYPFKFLSGVGLAYKLAQALGGLSTDNGEYLDLVALGTVADVLPVTGENRNLIRKGLLHLNKCPRIGLSALIESAGLSRKEISASHIGFVLGPRLNSCGRLGSARAGLHLLLTDSKTEADELAQGLEKNNRQRQKIEGEIMDEAAALIEKETDFARDAVIVLYKEDWHIGVLGIVASKLADRFYRPVILISLNKTHGRGSGRSIDDFHLFSALKECSEYLENYGGHAHAAGLSISVDKISGFKRKINEIAGRSFVLQDLRPGLEIDMKVEPIDITPDLLKGLEQLVPFGEGNSNPVFCASDLEVASTPRTLSRETLKFWVSDKNRRYEVVGFGMAGLANLIKPGERINLAYTPSLNEWQGITSLQLEMKDVKLSV
jgi:single-stranded-DNA-specific exonuclease